MATERLFVGREAELARFREALEDPAGKAILITGPERMGKTFLARRMLEEVGERRHPTLTCGTVSYQVTVTDYTDPRYDRILYLHIDALLQVTGGNDEDDPPLARILSRERATWHRALASHGITTDPVPDRLRRAAVGEEPQQPQPPPGRSRSPRGSPQDASAPVRRVPAGL